MIIVVYPLCLVPNLGSLRHASSVASLSLVFVVAIVIYEYMHIPHEAVHVRRRPTGWMNIVNAMPSYSVAYMFDLCSVAIYGRMRERTTSKYVAAGGISILIVFTLLNTIGGCAYYTFGADIQPNFMANYTNNTWLVAAAQILFGFKLCMEYPVLQYLGWTAVRSVLVACGGLRAETRLEGCARHNVDPVRALSSGCWILITILLAHYAKSVAKIIPLCSVVVLQFQFTLPGLTLFVALRQTPGMLRTQARRVGLGLFAVLLFLLGVGLTIVTIVNYVHGELHNM